MAEYNGVEKAAHIKEKLFWLASYAETTRSLTHMACLKARTDGFWHADS